jgi:hypothetical protein
VHVFHSCGFLVEFGLQDRIVHEVDACHASNHQVGRLVSRVITVVMVIVALASCTYYACSSHDRLNRIDIIKSAVSSSVLIECVRFVYSRGGRVILLSTNIDSIWPLVRRWEGSTNGRVHYVCCRPNIG